MNNIFLEYVINAFNEYITVGSSRSNKKLYPLHGAITKDILSVLGGGYKLKSIGYNDNKEGNILGRYYLKNVDITVYENNEPIAGYGVKFVMRNYSQNSNNYFENMLGETANIRANNIPYFQIFIIFDKLPHYKKGGEFSHYEEITENNIHKYIQLSKDNIDIFHHTPNKTLFVLLSLKDIPKDIKNEKEYNEFYKIHIKDSDLLFYSDKFTQENFGSIKNTVIYNDYEGFIEKTCHYIKSL